MLNYLLGIDLLPRRVTHDNTTISQGGEILELGLYPSWTPGGANLFAAPQTLANNQIAKEGNSEFSNLLDVSDSTNIQSELGLDTKINGEPNSLVEFMDSQESESTKVQDESSELTVNPLLVAPNQVLDSNSNLNPLMADLDKMRMQFFMQDKPVFEGNKALRQEVVTRYADLIESKPNLQILIPSGQDPLLSYPDGLSTNNNIQGVSHLNLDSNGFGKLNKLDHQSYVQQVDLADLSSDELNKSQTVIEILPNQFVVSSSNKRLEPVSTEIISDLENIETSESKENSLLGQLRELSHLDESQSSSDSSSKQEDKSSQFGDEVLVLREYEKAPVLSKFSNLISQEKVTPFMAQNLNAIKDSTHLIVEKGGGTAKIKLYPEGLGELEIQVKVTGNQVSVNFIAENDEVKKLFESNLKHLSSQFKEQNLQVDQMVVQMADNKNSSSFDTRQGQEQPNINLLRDMMNQSRQESFGRQSNTYQDFEGIRTYGRHQQTVDPISPASVATVNSRYQGQGRGGRLSLVG